MDYNFKYLDIVSRLEEEHKIKVENLIKKVKSSKTIVWVKFSRDLDDIYSEFIASTLAVVIDEMLKSKVSVLDEITVKRQEFKKYCNETFDTTYDYFLNINGLK